MSARDFVVSGDAEDGGTLEDPRGGNFLEDSRGGPKLIKKWLSFFGVQPIGKSSFSLVKDMPTKDKGKFSIEIPNQIIDKNISITDTTLVGRFIGARPNIDDVRSFVCKKWSLKGKVDVSEMAKGCLSFCFSCDEDKRDILCSSPWVMGRHTLVL